MATATTEPVRLPPALRAPKIIQGVAFMAQCSRVPALGRRYGSEYTVNLPIFGQTVVISDPALVKDVFSTSSDLIERPTQLGSVFGPGSTFSLNGDEHFGAVDWCSLHFTGSGCEPTSTSSKRR